MILEISLLLKTNVKMKDSVEHSKDLQATILPPLHFPVTKTESSNEKLQWYLEW